MDPFRLTPTPPGDIQPGHWVGEPNSYTQAPGEEWWHFSEQVDEGWDETVVVATKDLVIVDPDVYDDYDEGDGFNADGTGWIISSKHTGVIILFGIKTPVYWFNLRKEEEIHHPVLYNIYDVYVYEWQEWKYIREEKVAV